MKKAPRPIVEITWTDANSSHGWTDPGELRTMLAAPCFAVGYVIHETRDTICLSSCLDLSSADKKDPINAACGTMIIPKKMITGRRQLRK